MASSPVVGRELVVATTAVHWAVHTTSAAAGQTLVIRHDSNDRVSFMPGVVLACRKVGDLKGLTMGIDSLL